MRLERLQIGLQRGLGVNRDLPPAAELDHHVGTGAAAVSAADSGLLLEVAVLLHPGQLHDAAQLDLAPASAHHRRLERLGQVGGFGMQNPMRLRQRTDLLGELSVGLAAGAFDFLQLPVDAA